MHFLSIACLVVFVVLCARDAPHFACLAVIMLLLAIVQQIRASIPTNDEVVIGRALPHPPRRAGKL